MSSTWDDRELEPDAILLTDRVALVTGAARGIGQATAVALARFGANLAICDRDSDGLRETGRQIEALGRDVLQAVLDVRGSSAVDRFIAQTHERFAVLDVLVNNAGGGFFANFMDVSPKGEDALVRENFSQVTHLIRACVPLMTRGGSIVNVTSVEAHRAGPGFSIYSAMKAAVHSLTQSLALELAPRKIRVNCIAPDMIPTPGDDELGEDSAALGLEGVDPSPWPETGCTRDCAAATVYLASDLSRFVTGTTLHVDGGTHAAGGWKRRKDGGFVL